MPPRREEPATQAPEYPHSQTTPALVASLIHDPFYQAITVDCGDDDAARRSGLDLYFSYSLQEAARTGRCVIAQPPELGATAWILPRDPVVEARESAAKAERLGQVLGPLGNERYRRMVAFMAARAERVVPRSAWYLSIVGVLPAARGQGVGARLLAPTLAEAARAKATCYLETFSPRNVAFYARLGFSTVAGHFEPVTGSQYVVMRRDA